MISLFLRNERTADTAETNTRMRNITPRNVNPQLAVIPYEKEALLAYPKPARTLIIRITAEITESAGVTNTTQLPRSLFFSPRSKIGGMKRATENRKARIRSSPAKADILNEL